MPLWTKDDSAAGAPKIQINGGLGNPALGAASFGTTVVGLGDGEYVGKKAHTGWTRVIRGKGPVSSIAITAAGTGYSNTDFVRVSGGTTNAYASVTTNGSGGITALTLAPNVGGGFVNNSTISVGVFTAGSTGGSASAGTGATFTVTLGGRANRVQTECLVALSGMTSNNSTLT